jgi:23S rRNA (uracil1939-C5)-methyltransferase
MTALQRESAQRVRPGCPHFGLHAGACGGCKMQHLHPAAPGGGQAACWKTTSGTWPRSSPSVLRPIEGPAWGYRDRARLSVRTWPRRARCWSAFTSASRATWPTCRCAPCCRQGERMLMPLRELIGAMDQRDRLPQIELAAGRRRHGAGAAPPGAADACRPGAAARLCGRCTACSGGCSPRARTRCTCWTKAGRSWPTACPSSASPCRSSPPTSRRSTRTSTACWCSRALRLLQVPQAHERVIDWFCGLGNFTLPLATQARRCWASKAAPRWCSARGTTRAQRPGGKTSFEARNLFELTPTTCVHRAGRPLAGRPAARGRLRAGQGAGRPAAGRWLEPPRRIVYVSCNPATLARDAGLLVHQAGYRCAGRAW